MKNFPHALPVMGERTDLYRKLWFWAQVVGDYAERVSSGDKID